MGCIDNLVIDKTIVEEAKDRNKNLSCTWIDVKKAFDSINTNGWLSHNLPATCQIEGFHQKLLHSKLKEIWSKSGGVDHPLVSFLTKMTKTHLKIGQKYKFLLL